MEPFICPVCRADRPRQVHLDWCTYEGPDFDDTEVSDDDA
jgi:hypothetical protein